MRRIIAFLSLRCPHCLRGPIFHSLLQMHANCPNCGIVYEREQGYFMNAIFFGYVLGFLAILPLNALFFILRVDPWVLLFGNLALLTLLSPFIFRYSRALWMHLDEVLDPRLRSASGERKDAA